MTKQVGPVPVAGGLSGRSLGGLFTRNRLRASVVLICLVFSAMLWTGLLVEFNIERERIIESKRHENENLARVFEEHVARTIRAAEVTLREIASEYRRYGGKFELARYMKDFGIVLDPYNSISMVDQNGDQILASYSSTKPQNFKNTENFQFHSQYDTPTLFISKPRRGVATGKWTIYLSIRINNADGSFGGDAALGMDTAYFSRIYADLDLGKDSTVTLIGRDGIVRARSAGAEMFPGTNVDDNSVFTKRLATASYGSFIHPSRVDGITRINSYRALKDYPLVVLVGTSQAVALADHDQRRTSYLLAAGIMTAVILSLGLFVLFQIARLEGSNAALRFSEEKFSKAFHASPDWVALSKLDTGEFLEVNEGFERVSGYSRAEAIGRTALQLGIWAYPGQRAELVARLASGGVVRDIETSFRRKSGEERVIQLSLEVIDLGGEKCVLAIGRDVTELKRVSEANARLAAIVASSTDAIISRSLDDKILSWNAGAERLFGYTADEAVGQSISMIFPSDREEEIARNRALLAQGRSVVDRETVRLAKGGRRIDVSLSQSPIKDEQGAIAGVALVFRDISERKQSEASQRLAASVFDNAIDGIIIADENFKIVAVNRAFTDITGYSAAEAIGNSPRLLRSYHHDEAFYEAMRRAISEKGSWQGEIWDKRKNGELYCELLSISAVRDERGDITNYCAVFAEITERKAAEAKLVSLNDELEDRVAQRTVALNHANKELEAFSYSVSHDLRAPLRHISGFSAIVLKENEGKLDEASIDNLKRINAASERMGLVITDLLALARISRQEMRRLTFDLSELSTTVIKNLAQAHPERDVEVVIAPAMTVEGDPGLMHIVLENLLGNAWKFTSRTERARIEVGCEERAGELVYFVRDNGAGFDMKYSAKLFGAFQRLHSPEEFEGTGIGLSMVQRIVARHAGRIWAEAAVGKGATFYFTLGKNRQPARAGTGLTTG